MKEIIKRFINKLPYISTLNKNLIFYKSKLNYYQSNLFVPIGHYYSPLINLEEIIANEQEIFSKNKSLKGIKLNANDQFELLVKLKQYYELLPFTEKQTVENRYFYSNDAYCYIDVIILCSFILHFKPKKIIEVGSGFSSAAMLDINEKFFNDSIDITFIEPYPNTLENLVKTKDKFILIDKKIQNVDLRIFESLEENDILFIDSTHIIKTDSDVLFEIFEILPLLKPGVKIHFHDIFYPFEYPKEWVLDQKRNWNEIYFLHAFLMYNTDYKIIAFNSFLCENYHGWFMENMPLCLKNTGGSIWLEKIGL